MSSGSDYRRWHSDPTEQESSAAAQGRKNHRNTTTVGLFGRNTGHRHGIPRQNSAANRGALVRDPREEIVAWEERRQKEGNSDSTPIKSGTMKNSEIEDLKGENSAVGRERVIRDPRLDQESFLRRKTHEEEDKTLSGGSSIKLKTKTNWKSPGRKLMGGWSYGRELLGRRVTVGHNCRPSNFGGELEGRRNTVGGFDSFLEDDDESEEPATRSCVTGRPGRDEENEEDPAMWRHTPSAGAGSSSSSFGSSFRDMEDGEPMARPSEPVRRQRLNRSALDVNESRASLMNRLNEDAGAENVAGSMAKGTNRQKIRNSLKVCLEGMGFDPEDIQMAIISTNAKTSDDAEKVVAWLGDHGGESGKRAVAEDVDNETILVRFGGETNYMKHAHSTDNTNSTDTTATTQESDKQVEELKSTLRNLGFSKDEITRHKELYRRHSDNIDVQDYISAVLDAAEDEEEDKEENNDGFRPTPPPDFTSAPAAHAKGRTSKSEESHRVDCKNNLSVNRKDDRIIRSLTEMGFEEVKVQCAIDDLRRSGLTVSTEDADEVLSALLTGDVPSAKYKRSQSSRDLDEEDEEEDRQRTHSERISGSIPQERHTLLGERPDIHRPQCDGNPPSIEISPGQYARLLNGRQTWNAMHEGSAVSALCTICNVTLQCTPEADYVLCPDCDVVSPLIHKDASGRTSAGGRYGAVGLGYRGE